jgi:hypothetical protein
MVDVGAAIRTERLEISRPYCWCMHNIPSHTAITATSGNPKAIRLLVSWKHVYNSVRIFLQEHCETAVLMQIAFPA